MSSKSALKLLVTGTTGLVGSKFLGNFKQQFSITTVGRNNVDLKINLTSKTEVMKAIFSSDAGIVVNFAAFTNVDGAEREKGDRVGEVYMLNARLPLWLAKACKSTGKSLYHISTDYVFNGDEDNKPYTEKDLPKPVDSWYCLSKFDGETNVQEVFGDKGQFAILRISYPYSGTYTRRLDFARVIIEKLGKGQAYFGINDQKIKPVSVDDVAFALSFLIQKKAYGIYHVAGIYPNGFITPFDFAIKLARVCELDTSLIKPISFQEFSRQRISLRPRHTWLDTTKIETMGVRLTGIDEALTRFQKQLSGS